MTESGPVVLRTLAAHLAMLRARANVAVLYLYVRSAVPAKRVRSGSTDTQPDTGAATTLG